MNKEKIPFTIKVRLWKSNETGRVWINVYYGFDISTVTYELTSKRPNPMRTKFIALYNMAHPEGGVYMNLDIDNVRMIRGLAPTAAAIRRIDEYCVRNHMKNKGDE